jgi:hypothetical protein
MQVSNLSYKIAYEISGDRFLMEEFYKLAKPDEYILFLHINIIYSWNVISGHRVIPACYKCGKIDEDYNFAGRGHMYLRHNGVDKIRLHNGRYKTMEVYCKKHVKAFFEYSKPKPAGTQLTLF